VAVILAIYSSLSNFRSIYCALILQNDWVIRHNVLSNVELSVCSRIVAEYYNGALFLTYIS
jgi:hypothetical protein